MSIFNLIGNTIEGVAQVAINVVKLPVGVVVSPVDNGEAVQDAVAGVMEGVGKVGDAEERK